MPKYRSRTIVEAEEWQPGKKIEGVHELRDGRALLEARPATVFDGFVEASSPRFYEITAGTIVVRWRNADGSVCKRTSLRSWARFERDWEDIGG